jgi:lactoylglutathione lyase/methylmalonyl-CoA/ethylmalonyl-CoA epimerase
MTVTALDHVGVLVDSLDDAMRFAEDVLGLALEREGPQPELGVRTAFYRAGPVLVELIERASDASPLPPLGGAPARIDHIALECDDMRATVEAMAAAGVRMLDVGAGSDPLVLGRNLNHWTDPETADGVKYQLIEKDGATY